MIIYTYDGVVDDITGWMRAKVSEGCREEFEKTVLPELRKQGQKIGGEVQSSGLWIAGAVVVAALALSK